MAISSLIRPLLSAAVAWVAAEFLRGAEPAKRAVKYKVGGVLVLFAAFQAGMLAVLFFAASLFFALADIEPWARPAAITGVVLIAIAGLLAWEGLALFRKNDPY